MNTEKLNKSLKFGLPSSAFIDKILSLRDNSIKDEIKYFTAYILAKDYTNTNISTEYVLPIFSFNNFLYFIGICSTDDDWSTMASFYIGTWPLKDIKIKKTPKDTSIFYNLNCSIELFEELLFNKIVENEDMTKYLITH